MKLATYMYEGMENWGFVLTNPQDGKEWIYNPGKVQAILRKVAANHTHASYASLPDFIRLSQWPDSLQGFLELEEKGMDTLQKMVSYTEQSLTRGDTYALSLAGVPVSEVKLRAPIPRPRIFLGLVRNCPAFYRTKPQVRNVSLLPIMHQRPTASIIGENDIKSIIAVGSGNVELGFIVGKKGKNIPIEEAHKYIAGYTVVIDDEIKTNFGVMNQAITEQYGADAVAKTNIGLEQSNCGLLGKCSDARCAAGPYLVTSDEVGNPYDLLVYTGHNDLVRDRAHTAALAIGAERLITWYSTIAQVNPGDVFHLGTAGTDGIFIDDEMRKKVSKTVYSEIERIGRLTIRVAGTEEKLAEGIAEYDYPYVPSLDDLQKAGKDVIAAPENWKLEDMNNIWISMYNHKNCLALDNYKIIAPYPKAFNSPRKSVAMNGSEITVNRRATTLTVGLELAFVLKKPAFRIDPAKADDYILGYTPVLSVADRSIREEYDVGATDYISGNEVHRFVDLYGRWADGSNIVDTPKPLKNLSGLKLKLTVEGHGQAETTTEEYIHMPEKYLDFMTRECTLFPGDIITMSVGSARIILPEGTDIDGLQISGEIEGLGTVSATMRREQI